MKKTLTLVLVLMLLCSLFTACGGSSTPPAATSAPAAAKTSAPANAPAAADKDDGADDYTEEYLEAMDSFIPGFEEVVGMLSELLALSNEIATEEDLELWCNEFDNIKAIVGTSADELANVAEHVPEDYMESHVAITIAVAAVYDAMTGFEGVVIGAMSGDAEAFETGLVEFVANIVIADELWQSAVAE